MTDHSQQTTQATIKKLYRSKMDRMLGGVSGGLSDYFGIDVVVIRVLFVLFAFYGFGIITYLLLWIFVPENTEENQDRTTHSRQESSGTYSFRFSHQLQLVLGIFLLVVGLFWLMDNLNFTWYTQIMRWVEDFTFPAFLIFIGIAIIYFTYHPLKGSLTMNTTPPKKLTRVTSERMVSGVCSGLGYYFGIDPVIVRVLFVISFFVSFGITLIVYLALAILTPAEDMASNQNESDSSLDPGKES